jgi:hypothetical protein
MIARIPSTILLPPATATLTHFLNPLDHFFGNYQVPDNFPESSPIVTMEAACSHSPKRALQIDEGALSMLGLGETLCK